MATNSQPIVSGNKVCFIGGPEAGRVRIIPESVGDHVQCDDYVYRIWPMRMEGDNRIMYFAFDASQHPLQMYVQMWREYSVVAQIKTHDPTIAQTYNTVKASHPGSP